MGMVLACFTHLLTVFFYSCAFTGYWIFLKGARVSEGWYYRGHWNTCNETCTDVSHWNSHQVILYTFYINCKSILLQISLTQKSQNSYNLTDRRSLGTIGKTERLYLSLYHACSPSNRSLTSEQKYHDLKIEKSLFTIQPYCYSCIINLRSLM